MVTRDTARATNTDPLQLLNIFYTKNPYLGEENEHSRMEQSFIFIWFSKKMESFWDWLITQGTNICGIRTLQYIYYTALLNQTTHLMSKCPIWGSPRTSFIVDGTTASLYSLNRGPEVGGQRGQYWSAHWGAVVTLYCRSRPQECTSLVNWQSSPNGVFGLVSGSY